MAVFRIANSVKSCIMNTNKVCAFKILQDINKHHLSRTSVRLLNLSAGIFPVDENHGLSHPLSIKGNAKFRYEKLTQQVFRQQPSYSKYFIGLSKTLQPKLNDKNYAEEILIHLENGDFQRNIDTIVSWIFTLSELVERTEQRELIKKSRVHENISRYLKQRLSELNDEQLLLLIHKISSYFISFRMKKCVLELCSARAPAWHTDMLFLVGCALYDQEVFGADKFFKNMFITIENNKFKLKKEELVLVFAFANKFNVNPFNYIRGLDEKILQKIMDMSLDEAGVICTFMYRIGRQHILITECVLKKLDLSFSEAQEAVIQTFVKLFVLNFRRRQVEGFPYIFSILKNLAVKFESNVPFYDSTTVLRILIAYFRSRWITEGLLNAIEKRAMKELEFDRIAGGRLKDVINWINHLVAIGNVSSKVIQTFSDKFTEKLKDRDFYDDKYLIFRCLHSLSQYNIYPDLLFDREFVEKLKVVHKDASFDNEDLRDFEESDSEDLLEINIRLTYYVDQSLKMDNPDCRADILDKSLLESLPEDKYLFKREGIEMNMRNKHTYRDHFIIGILNLLCPLYGFDSHECGFLIPSANTADILLCIDERGIPIRSEIWRHSLNLFIPLAADYHERKRKTIAAFDNPVEIQSLPTVKGDITRLAVVVHLPYAYSRIQQSDGSEKRLLKSIPRAKLRHLIKTGYKVVEICSYEFDEAENKKQFLKEKLDQHIRAPLPLESNKMNGHRKDSDFGFEL